MKSVLQETFEKVERAKQEWEATLDSLPELICLVDRQGQVLRANHTLERWRLGWVQTVKGQDLHGLLHPGCTTATCPLNARLAEAREKACSGQATQFEIYDPILTRHLLIQVRPVAARSQVAPATTAVILEDITQHKRQEAALQESRERYHQLIDTAAFGVAIFAATGELTLMNPAFRALLGLEPEPTVGVCNAFTLPPLVGSGLADDIRRCADTGEQTIVERTLATGETSRYLRTNLTPLHDPQQTVVGVQVLAEDVTDLKRLESQRSQAQKLEAVGALAAGIAHEINTPTQFISDNVHFFADAFADLRRLLDSYQELSRQIRAAGLGLAPLDHVAHVEQDIDLAYLLAEIPQALAQTQEGVARVAAIVSAMRSFAHPGNGTRGFANLNQALENTLVVARSEYKHSADVETDLDPALPLVPCNLGEINQVFLNLIVNAAHAIQEKATTSGEPRKQETITVRTRRIGDEAIITIGDTGGGIPPEIQHRIFDPFFTTKEPGKGTGQGLTIAHDVIVRKHRGQLYFASAVGEGTTFTIHLPLDEGDGHSP